MRSDGALLEAWAQGDRTAGATLFDRHFDALSRFFRNKASDAADDLIQQTLLACVEARDRYSAASSFRTFLFGIGKNVLFNHYRGQRRGGPPVDFAVSALVEIAPSATSVLAEAGRQRALLEALRSIPLQSQVMLELVFWERMTAPQVAEVVDAPEGTVRTRLRRAKELLARELRRIENLGLPLAETMQRLDGWADEVRRAHMPGVAKEKTASNL